MRLSWAIKPSNGLFIVWNRGWQRIVSDPQVSLIPQSDLIAIKLRWKKIGGSKAADVKGSSHHFRHTHAIELLKSGIDIRTVQKALGHSSLGTTEKYYSRWNLAQQDLMDASLQGALAGK